MARAGVGASAGVLSGHASPRLSQGKAHRHAQLPGDERAERDGSLEACEQMTTRSAVPAPRPAGLGLQQPPPRPPFNLSELPGRTGLSQGHT